MNHVRGIFCVSVLLACQVYARPQENTAAVAPATKTANVTLVKNDITPLDSKGSFGYDIELSDGTKFMQSGHTEAPLMGETDSSLSIQGSYAYVAPDGKSIQITYVADRNGFQPKGDAIPTQGPAIGGAPAPAADSAEKSAPPPPAAPVAASASASAAGTPAPESK